MIKVKILTLDTETYNGLIGGLKRIAIYDGKKIYYGYQFSDVENILNNYRDAGYNVHVYIHNLEFDLRKIPIVFEPGRVEWKKSMIINNNIVKFVSNGITFQDSAALLPSSLADLSHDFNIEHSKIDLWDAVQSIYPGRYKNVVDFLDRCNVDDELFLRYLGYDVMSLYEIIYTIIKMMNIPVDKFVNIYTNSSLSRYVFKNGYGGTGVNKYTKFKHDGCKKTDYQIMCSYKWENDEIEEFVRLAYAGGRCEIFKPLCECDANYYDFNSLYPFVMSKHEFPIGKPEFSSNEWVVRREWERFVHKYKNGIELYGIINCRVYVPEQNIPPLPVKMGKLTFPTGDICGAWTYQELYYAITKCGCKIIEYYSVCTFTYSFPVFENFIKIFSEIKQNAGQKKLKALKTFAKLIQNVSYGYTGMSREDKYKLDNILNRNNYRKNEIFFEDPQLGFIQIYSNVDSEYIQPQIATYVTSYARLEWLKMAKMCEKLGGNVYYGDTDSIITDIELPSDIIDDNKLGYLALEYKIKSGIFIKPKVYGLKLRESEKTEKLKFKGVSRDTIGNLSYSYYQDLYNMQVNGVDEFVVEHGRNMLRGIIYLTKNHIDYSNFETRDKKIYFNQKEKRVFDFDNNTSKPWHFKTIDDFMKFNYNNIDDVVLNI